MTVRNKKLLLIAAFNLLCGLIGAIAGRFLISALPSSPAWLGPAIIVGSVALLTIAALLLPVAIRISASVKHEPAA